MFSISRKDENSFEKIILSDNYSGTIAAIIPACGAILHAFEIDHNGERINAVESYSSKNDFEMNAETKGFLGAKLSPFVCRLKNGAYHFGENKYKFEKFYLGKDALHGSVYDKAFTVISETANDNSASVSMMYEYRSDDKGYPFNYDCIVTWQLQKNNFLTLITECINKDEGLIPLQDGWHPYFNLSDAVDNLQLEFQSKEIVEFDEDLIPTKKLIEYNSFNSLKKIGDTFFDNCFTLNMHACQPLCVLRNPAKKIELEIYPDTSYPYLQIYIPPHRKTIAIENLSGAPDAFNNNMGFITLEPQQSAVFKTSYKLKSL